METEKKKNLSNYWHFFLKSQFPSVNTHERIRGVIHAIKFYWDSFKSPQWKWHMVLLKVSSVPTTTLKSDNEWRHSGIPHRSVWYPSLIKHMHTSATQHYSVLVLFLIKLVNLTTSDQFSEIFWWRESSDGIKASSLSYHGRHNSVRVMLSALSSHLLPVLCTTLLMKGLLVSHFYLRRHSDTQRSQNGAQLRINQTFCLIFLREY